MTNKNMKTAYKMNINQFISLCVKTKTEHAIFSPLGFPLAVVSQNIDMSNYNHNGTVQIYTKDNSQLQIGTIIIVQ